MRDKMTDNLIFRDTGELVVQIPALQRPTLEELRKECKEDFQCIKHDISPTKPIVFRLGTVLQSSESSIGTIECQRRVALQPNIIGRQQLKWLFENKDKLTGFKYLMTQIYIEGHGLSIIDSLGYERIPRLSSFLHWTYITESCSRFFSFGRIGYYQSR